MFVIPTFPRRKTSGMTERMSFPRRDCVIARERGDRSNLISCRTHGITTTPERRHVMTKEDCDTVSKAGIHTYSLDARQTCPRSFLSGKTSGMTKKVIPAKAGIQENQLVLDTGLA